VFHGASAIRRDRPGSMIAFELRGITMIDWKRIDEFSEPDWEKTGTSVPPTLFWRVQKGAVLGYVRDGELFDWKWIYVCDANKVTHFSEINGPESNVLDLESFRASNGNHPRSA
jgi:hypothetical protein